ncbi:MAG: chorismate mutase [Euryarchaeota archaeon]|nr:chorismate mutase [Euryarchaeota archaeon]
MPSLQELRQETHELDEQILDLIHRRTELGRQIMDLKRQQGMELYDEAHIRDLLQWAESEARKRGISPKILKNIYSELVELRMERELREASKTPDEPAPGAKSGAQAPKALKAIGELAGKMEKELRRVRK